MFVLDGLQIIFRFSLIFSKCYRDSVSVANGLLYRIIIYLELCGFGTAKISPILTGYLYHAHCTILPDTSIFKSYKHVFKC